MLQRCKNMLNGAHSSKSVICNVIQTNQLFQCIRCNTCLTLQDVRDTWHRHAIPYLSSEEKYEKDYMFPEMLDAFPSSSKPWLRPCPPRINCSWSARVLMLSYMYRHMRSSYFLQADNHRRFVLILGNKLSCFMRVYCFADVTRISLL